VVKAIALLFTILVFSWPKLLEGMVEPTFAVRLKVWPVINEVLVPLVGTRATSFAANAGAPANKEVPRATTAPSAKPLRVRFLDMYVSFFLGFLEIQDGNQAATS
jgi:hypothetical protein